MARYYVDITGLPRETLEFLGYTVVFEDNEHMLLVNKGDHHILPKKGKQYIYVHDINDAALLRSRPRIPVPKKL